MSIELHSAGASHDPTDPLTFAQKETLQRAVAKMFALGAKAGISVEQMIELLTAGLTVRELLQYLAARSGHVV
jgi:hypothetical protein